MATTKSFEISKQVVWEAYKRVKANNGAAGIDNESIAQFEQHLKRNLYKVWNRMSSGSYLPPPVKQLEIPKKDGGIRILGAEHVNLFRTVVKKITYICYLKAIHRTALRWSACTVDDPLLT